MRREYVDVIVRVAASGAETPRAIIMADGRMFGIDRTTYRTHVAGGLRYTVHIGSHVTHLYKDTCSSPGARWYVQPHDA